MARVLAQRTPAGRQVSTTEEVKEKGQSAVATPLARGSSIMNNATRNSSAPAGSLQGPTSGNEFDKAPSTFAKMKKARRWLVNKIVPVPGQAKPDHIITYVSGKVRRGRGIHGTPEDMAQWGTYEQAKAWCDSHPDYLPSFALGADDQ